MRMVYNQERVKLDDRTGHRYVTDVTRRVLLSGSRRVNNGEQSTINSTSYVLSTNSGEIYRCLSGDTCVHPIMHLYLATIVSIITEVKEATWYHVHLYNYKTWHGLVW